MPNFLRDVRVSNLVLHDEALQDLNGVLLQRIDAHNQGVQEDDKKLLPVYVVRFDSRGYRTFSADEAWSFYKGAESVERVVLSADSVVSIGSNRQNGSYAEIRLDSDRTGSSHIIVGGESKDWVEATFSALETSLRRRKDLATSLIRTSWAHLILQVLGVLVGLLLALWLATLTAPYLKGVDYPRTVSFAFWFLVYSNLWTYLQQQALQSIDRLFPNVRFSRSGDHWVQSLLREGVKALAIALLLWAFTWVTKWAGLVIAPLLTQGA